MVRATATVVKRMFGDTYPPGWTATTVGYLCDHTDADFDELGLGTDTAAVNLANRITYRRVIHAQWANAGGPLSGMPEPSIWTKDLMDLRKNLADQGTHEFVASVDGVNDGDR